MKGWKTVQIGVFTLINFFFLVLGMNELSSLVYNNSISFLTSKLKNSFYALDTRHGQPTDDLCFGPFYKKSEAYHQASTFRDLGIFPRKEVLEVNNFDQQFVVIGSYLSTDESATISKELSLLDIPHFKVPSGEGPMIHIEVPKEKRARDLQFDALAYLGRPLEYVEVERQATLYFLRIHESHHGKLTHIKEKRCIGIAPLL